MYLSSTLLKGSSDVLVLLVLRRAMKQRERRNTLTRPLWVSLIGVFGIAHRARSKKSRIDGLDFDISPFSGTSRLHVEISKEVAEKPRPWSKYSEGSAAYEKSHPEASKQRAKELEEQKREKLEKQVGNSLRLGCEFLGLESFGKIGRSRMKMSKYFVLKLLIELLCVLNNF